MFFKNTQLFFSDFPGAARALGGASHAAEEPGRAHGTAPGAADARWTDGHGGWPWRGLGIRLGPRLGVLKSRGKWPVTMGK